MKFSIFTFGCRVNSAESEIISLKLQKNNWQSVSAECADLVIINSCAVTQKAEREAKQLVYQLKRKNPKVKIVVTGCSATLWQKNKILIKGVDLLVQNKDKANVVKLIEKFNLKSKEINNTINIDKFVNSGRLMLKVQDGCDYFCTYCIVPYTRDRSVSFTPNEVLKNFKEMSKIAEIKEIILTGINLGLYGKEWKGSFTEMVKFMLDNTSVPLISFGSLYVENLTKEFFALWKNKNYVSRLTTAFHIPLQSASPKILKLMRRRYSLLQFDKKIKALIKVIPKAKIATDIIVGFLGETEDEFKKTYDYLAKTPIYRAHIFRFSNRPGTAAYYLKDRLYNPSDKEKKDRAEKLKKLFLGKFVKIKQI